MLGSEKGTYVLILKLEKESIIKVGALGMRTFKIGFYAYIGSAFGRGGLKARISRYSKVRRQRWHVDCILDSMETIEVWAIPNTRIEEELAGDAIKVFDCIKGFGCTDKRGDISHLLYLSNKDLLSEFKRLIENHGLRRSYAYKCKKASKCLTEKKY
jgi:Uri superfamily endonuclease